jgi:hypothetical protein
MSQQLTKEIIHRCLTKTPEECPREYDASVIGKWLICKDPRQSKDSMS